MVMPPPVAPKGNDTSQPSSLGKDTPRQQRSLEARINATTPATFMDACPEFNLTSQEEVYAFCAQQHIWLSFHDYLNVRRPDNGGYRGPNGSEVLKSEVRTHLHTCKYKGRYVNEFPDFMERKARWMIKIFNRHDSEGEIWHGAGYTFDEKFDAMLGLNAFLNANCGLQRNVTIHFKKIEEHFRNNLVLNLVLSSNQPKPRGDEDDSYGGHHSVPKPDAKKPNAKNVSSTVNGSEEEGEENSDYPEASRIDKAKSNRRSPIPTGLPTNTSTPQPRKIATPHIRRHTATQSLNPQVSNGSRRASITPGTTFATKLGDLVHETKSEFRGKRSYQDLKDNMIKAMEATIELLNDSEEEEEVEEEDIAEMVRRQYTSKRQNK